MRKYPHSLKPKDQIMDKGKGFRLLDFSTATYKAGQRRSSVFMKLKERRCESKKFISSKAGLVKSKP